MKEKRRFSLKTVIISAVSAFVLGAGVLALAAWLLLGRGGFALLQAAVYIDQNFVADYDRDALVDNALAAMVGSLDDRWSYYLNAEELAATEERRENQYTGAGFTYVRPEGTAEMQVVAVAAGGPAEQAGLAVGDTVVAVNGQRLTQENFEALTGTSWNEAGAEVAMTVRSAQGEERELVVTVGVVEQDPVSAELLEDGMGYIRLSNFYHRSAERVREATAELLGQGAKGILFDVRGNPGGFVSELKDILDYLLPEGPIFTETTHRGKTSVTESDASCVEVPMVVLVDEHSYSAAELFAAQLRESVNAGLVGQVTSGKGYYQVLHYLPNGGALGVSVGEYATGGGKSLIGEGLTPDILEDDPDVQLERARELLRERMEQETGRNGG